MIEFGRKTWKKKNSSPNRNSEKKKTNESGRDARGTNGVLRIKLSNDSNEILVA